VKRSALRRARSVPSFDARRNLCWLFISNAGGTAGDGQGGGSVLETLLNLILSEKAGINLQEITGSSKSMEDFIRQFTGSRSAGNGDPCGVGD